MAELALDDVEAIAARLAAAGRPVSAHTMASYERRWRIWQRFAEVHGVPALPADPDHLMAFVIARRRAGAGHETVSANLAAVAWFHTQLTDAGSDVCAPARTVLNALRQETTAVARRAAPVLSLGALEAMVQAPVSGVTRYSSKLLRFLTGLRPRQLSTLRRADICFGPDYGWVELKCVKVPRSGKHPALEGTAIRLDAAPVPTDCPVEAVRNLLAAVGGDDLFPNGFHVYGSIQEFEPGLERDAVPLQIAVRNRAIVATGYAGALRPQELVRLEVGHIEPTADGYLLNLVDAKTSGGGRHQSVRVPRDGTGLDSPAAIDRWLAVRGDHDGPLFTSVHHSAADAAGRSALTDGEIRDLIGELAAHVGLPKGVTGYSLRRSWATHQYLREPRALATIQRHLRHTSVSTTARYIQDLDLDRLDARALLSRTEVCASASAPPGRKDVGTTDESLEALVAEAAERSADGQTPSPATQRSSRSKWEVWARWAEEHRLDALPATPEALALFAAERATSGITAEVLGRQLLEIRRRHAAAGLPTEGLTALADEVRAGLAGLADRPAAPAPVLTVEEVRALAEAAGAGADQGDLYALRDVLIVAVVYGGALRLSEVRRTRLEAIEPVQGGLVLELSGTGAAHATPEPRSVLLASRPDCLDPVRAVASWTSATGLSSGPLVPSIHPDTDAPLGERTLRSRLRLLAEKAGVPEPAGLSLRRSWATHAYLAGVDPLAISRHLRHQDLAGSLEAISRLSPWLENPAVDLAEARSGGSDPTGTRDG